MKKYKYILTLPGGFEIDSSEEIDNEEIWTPEDEQIELKGIFDSYEEAAEAASQIEVYQYVIYPNRDKTLAKKSYDAEKGKGYSFCAYDIIDEAIDHMDIICGMVWLEAEKYVIEKLNKNDYGYDPNNKKFKVTFFSHGEKLFCSTEDGDLFDSREEAEIYVSDFDQGPDGEYLIQFEAEIGKDCDIDTVEIVKTEIVEYDE